MLSYLSPLWLFLALITPIVTTFVIVWFNGNTAYTFALSVSLLGIALIFISTFKERRIFKIKTTSVVKNSSGRIIFAKGMIPYWVPILLVVGFGFVPSGLIIALLLWLGIIINRAY